MSNSSSKLKREEALERLREQASRGFFKQGLAFFHTSEWKEIQKMRKEIEMSIEMSQP